MPPNAVGSCFLRVPLISRGGGYLGCPPKVFDQILRLGRAGALLKKLAGCAQGTNFLGDRCGNELIQRHAVNFCKFGSFRGYVLLLILVTPSKIRLVSGF